MHASVDDGHNGAARQQKAARQVSFTERRSLLLLTLYHIRPTVGALRGASPAPSRSPCGLRDSASRRTGASAETGGRGAPRPRGLPGAEPKRATLHRLCRFRARSCSEETYGFSATSSRSRRRPCRRRSCFVRGSGAFGGLRTLRPRGGSRSPPGSALPHEPRWYNVTCYNIVLII